MALQIVMNSKPCSGPSCTQEVPVDSFGSARRVGSNFFCSEKCETEWEKDEACRHAQSIQPLSDAAVVAS